MNQPSCPIRRRGISLAEVVVSSLLIGIVLVGAMNQLGATLKTRQAMSDQLDGPRLAEEMLAEILSHPYTDPEEPGGENGLNAGESAPRSNFDDIDDFDDWNASPPVDRDGIPMPEFTGWTRHVEVAWAERLGGNPWFSETGLKRIYVRVTAPDSKTYERWAFHHEAGPLEQTPAVDTLVVTRIEGELQLGVGSTAKSATSLVNHPADRVP